MACYYLVISSTHLSNGHLRSIKGVFRGPLCASGGAESPQDYAGKEKAITKALENLKANFYCELCDKQYHKHQEFDNHINSYDHAHKQRLKELKQREFARNVSSKSWKDERKQEKALKRLHQIALLKQQRDSDKEKKTKLIATDQDNQQIRINGSDKSGSENIIFDDQNHSSPSADFKTIKTSPFEPVLENQCSLRFKCSSLIAQTPKDHRHPKAGISFCFSKRAHLKLDSCASVFTEGLDETSDHQDVRRQQQKLALQALLSQSPSSTQDDHHVPLDPMPLNTSPQRDILTDHPNQEDSLEMQVMYCTIEAQGKCCPDRHGSEVGRQPASSKDKAPDISQKSKQEIPYKELERNSLKNPSFDGHNNVGQQTAQHSKQDWQRSSKQDNSMTGDCLAEGDLSSKTFLNVIGKDGTELKWPGELVQYTSDGPSVSYSCNPLLLSLKCPEEEKKSTGAENTDAYTISDQPSRAEEQTPNVSNVNLGIVKPKKHKHRHRGKIRLCKIDAVRRHRVACALSNFSQSPAEGQFEFNSTPARKLRSKQYCTKKRHKLRNRTTSQNEPQQLHLKSIIVNAFSAPQRRRRKRQRLRSALRLAKRKALLHVPIQSSVGYGDNYQWCHDFCKSKQNDNVTPIKSSSWGVLSEMSSDREWPACQWKRHCNSYASTSYYPRRRVYNQPCSYIRKSRYSFPYYGYRHMSNSQGKDTELREEYCNYRDSELYKERNYDEVSDSIIKQRFGIRRRKRNLRENGYRDCRNPSTKRICFYRVYEDEDEDDPHHTERDWWCERPSPDLRRHKRRNRFCLRSAMSQERGNKQNRLMLRHSPASSITTSISDISANCSTFNKQSCSGQRDLKCPEESSGKTKHFHSREHTPRQKSPSTSIEQSGAVQSDIQPNISHFKGKLELVAQNSKSSDLTKQSTTEEKLANNRICTLSLPLIGKLPSIKKGIKQSGMHKAKDSSSSCCKQVKTHLNDPSKPESQAVFKTAHIATQNSTLSQACLSLTDQRTAIGCPNLDTQKDRHVSHEILNRVLEKTTDKTPDNPQSCLIPPLTEKPITFTAEEMDKYRLLQLQAQQHVQQKHLQELHDMPRSPFASQMDQIPIPIPESLNQTVPGSCLSYTIHQHGSLSTSFISCPSACLAPRSSPSAHPPLRPTLPQTHFTAFPFPTVFYPASPTVMLATHPLHLISAAPLHHSHPHSHIAGLTLHPTPHASLLPSMLTPAAMVAGRSLQIHPTPQPLFSHQDIHHHPSIAS